MLGSVRALVKVGGEPREALLPRTESAFVGERFWAGFVGDARAIGDARLNAWLDRWAPIIAWQFHRRGRPSTRSVDHPLPTGGLETVIKPVEAALHGAATGSRTASA